MNAIKQGYKQTKVGIIPEDWDVVKVGEKFDFLKTYSNSREDLNNEDEISYIHYGEIHTKHKFYIDFEKFDLPKINKSKLPNEVIFAQNGDLVIADASEDYADIGKSAEIKNLTSKAVSGLHTFLLRDKSKNFADGYKGYLFYNETVSKNIKKIATGISVLGISKTNLSNLEIPLPSLKEQEKIAEILTTWDEAISLHVKLIEEKEQLKIGLMQKLLSGEVRFEGFCDEWEEVRLGEICNITTGKLNANAMVENGKYIFFTCARETYKIDKFAFDTEALLVSGNGANVGYIHYFKGKFNAYQRTYVLDGFEHNIFLIKYLLDKYLSLQISREKNEGNTPYITLPTLTKMKLKLPSFSEQQKIAEVLSLADDELNLHKKELEELKQQKKGLMQKLLTGEVRVKV